MSGNTVETTGAETAGGAQSPVTPTSNTVPATPALDLNHPDVKAAIAREAQREADKRAAKLHQQYQQQLKSVKGEAVERLRAVGDRGADDWAEFQELRAKAAQLDAAQAEADRWQQWTQYVEQVASAYGLKGSDPRLAAAADANDLLARAKAAMSEDARAERERIKSEADAAERTRADQKVNSGALDAVGAGVPVAETADALMAEYRSKLKPLQGKVEAIAQLQHEYRAKGLPI